MSSLHVYDVGLELEPVEPSALPSGAVGGFTCCFVLATTIEDAVQHARAAMESEGYRVVDADHCVRIDLEEYEPQEGQPDLSDLLSLERPGSFALSTIHTFERIDDEEPN